MIVTKLHETLYGMRQSARSWNQALNEALLKMGFSLLIIIANEFLVLYIPSLPRALKFVPI